MIKVVACVSALLAQSHNLVKRPIVRMSSSTTNILSDAVQGRLSHVGYSSTFEVKLHGEVGSEQNLQRLYSNIKLQDGCRLAHLFQNPIDPSLYTIFTQWKNFEAYTTCMRNHWIISGVAQWGTLKIGKGDFEREVN